MKNILALSSVEKSLSDGAFRALMENANDSIFVLDEDARILCANRQAERLLGCSRSGIEGRPCLEFVLPEDMDYAVSDLEKVFMGQAFITNPIRLKRIDEKVVYAQFSAVPLDMDGRKIIMTIGRDVTEQLKMEADRIRLAAIVESTTDGIAGTDMNGIVLSWNPGAEEIYGYKAGEVIGHSVGMLAPPGLEGEFLEMIQRSKSGEIISGHETIRKRKDGKIIHVSVTTSLIGNAKGEWVETASIIRDITKRKLAEEEHARLASIVESSSDAIYGIDLEGTIDIWNPAAEQLYGYGPAEIIGNPMFTLAPSENHAQLFEVLEVCRRGEAVPPFETVHKNRNQQKVDVFTSFFPLKDKQGRVKGYSVIARDITERKKEEESVRKREIVLRQAQKMEAIGQLAAGIAHDFNNILAVVGGNCEFLTSEMDKTDARREEVDEIQKAVRRGSDLTKQLLIFGRKDVYQPSLIRLNGIFDESGKMLQRMVGENVELGFKVDPSLKGIRADVIQIQQILMNLSANARDAMPRGGKLHIEARNLDLEESYQKPKEEIPAGSYVLLSFSDTGTGMSPEIQERVFEPFFTTKGPSKGTGLGLSTVYGIVKQSGGYIWIYSEKGKGTIFNIAFPAVEASTITPLQAPVRTSLSGSETVLLVEDEEAIRRIMVRSLQRNGYKVLEASNGEEGLKIATQNSGKIQMLLTDTMMPKMSGKELADIIRSTRAHIRILFMSGYPREVLSKQGFLDAGTHLIQKPFSGEALLLKVREVLEEKRV